MPSPKRNYKKEYQEYQGQPAQIKNRAERNAARAVEVKLGNAKKGDGKDVDHIKPLIKGGSTATSNLRVVSASKNRSYPRTRSARMK